MPEHPVQLVMTDDLRRSRLTVLFRLLLAIPHLIWFVLWSIVVVVAAIVAWVAALATGRLPDGFHRFFCSYIRYTVQLTGYLYLVANPYPSFTPGAALYELDVRLPGAAPQNRWQILVRIVLAIPALALTAALGSSGFGGWSSAGDRNQSYNAGTTGLGAVVAVLGWFASLATGRMPRGLRDAGAYTIGYHAQTLAYLLLVTESYPNADPTAMLMGLDRPPEHPVHLIGEAADLRRSRVTVLFRLPLTVPHLVWLALWSVAALIAAIIQWFVLLFRARPADSLHTFLTRYVRYAFHVGAFLALAANPFPGFTGAPATYPLDLELPPPERQNRWKTGFRVILVIPAYAVFAGLEASLFVAAVLMWFYALVTGSAPWGLRNFAAYALRYGGQVNAYLYLLTEAYPHASPLEGEAEPPAVVPVEVVAA
jgi:hypothetical protein